MADGCSDTVISGITAADYHDFLSLCRNISAIFQTIVQQCLGCGFQEVYSEINSFCLSARSFDISRI